MEDKQRFYIETPLVESQSLTKTIRGGKIYLKLENTQPSGSFKLRGISNLILQEVKKGKRKLVCSSGGNAGLAAAYTAKKLNIPLILFVPTTTKPEVISKLRNEGAKVIVHGASWDDTDKRAREEVKDDTTAYIHPFDHKDIWEGHGNMIVELASQMRDTPDLVVLCVGGGGLLAGVCNGLNRVGWGHVPLLTLETEGADSFHQSDLADRLVTLPAITSIATSLGARKVAEEALRVRKSHRIISKVVTDRDCVVAVSRFLDDHHFLVEPSCGASLAAFYSGLIRNMQNAGELKEHLENVVVVVCGGSGITMESLQEWKKMFRIEGNQ